ncbi:MAG: HAD-IC family P-type ATPase [Betaproteobacteria bacterium]|nr:HAD-IC family P-type ATPase [Betaproteobacteria bacterium]
MAALDSCGTGLASDEVLRRRARHGPNRLPQSPLPSLLQRFLLQFHNVLIYVLLGSAAITLVLGHVADTLVILAVVLANAVIGFLQEGKAERSMEAIRRMLAPRASVLRDGVRQNVDAQDLVPGDMVLLQAGDRVPADLRLLEVYGLAAEEAVLTGESVPVDKAVVAVAESAALGDRLGMAFSGTLAVTGQARGVVVATGAATEIGRISGMLSAIESLETPLVRQMDRFARWLTGVILAVSGLLRAHGYVVSGQAFTEIFMVVVGLAVAAIPEGLPAVMTITLAIGVNAMAKRQAIVRRLPAIETLGSVSVICTDKTGTLTRNEMAGVAVAAGRAGWTVCGSGYAPEGRVLPGAQDAGAVERLRELALAATLCNDAALHHHEGRWSVEGDPMEGALLSLAIKCGVDIDGERRRWRRSDAIAFDARHRYMAVLCHDHEGHALIVAKGAPERILQMCRDERAGHGSTAAVDGAYWQGRIDAMAADGQRVLAFAMLAVPVERTVLQSAELEGALSLIGMAGLVDPPRPEAVAAVAECRRAGIRVKMITGDHAGTALAIARQVGLEHAQQALTGAELDRLDDTALARSVMQADVFARTSPEHKLRLVQALQSRGLTVAMTGDGVNDAPALKRADAGVAMGLKGSEAAKEAAELVLADDNFASIVAAIREGRTVYENLKKVISWTLPTNGGEALTLIVALLAGLSLPVTPIQILWVNLITATTLGLALAFEPSEAEVMRQPPRTRDEPLLTAGLVWQILLVSLLVVGCVFGVYWIAIERGHQVELARTLALNMLVVTEIAYLFSIRNRHASSLSLAALRGTRAVWTAVVLVVLAQLAVTFMPLLQAVFDTRSLPPAEALLLAVFGLAFFAAVEVEKAWRMRAGRP